MGMTVKQIKLKSGKGFVEVQKDTDMGSGEFYVYHVLQEDNGNPPVDSVHNSQRKAEAAAKKLAGSVK